MSNNIRNAIASLAIMEENFSKKELYLIEVKRNIDLGYEFLYEFLDQTKKEFPSGKMCTVLMKYEK